MRPREGRRGGCVGTLLTRCVAIAAIAASPVAFTAWMDPAHILGAPNDEAEIASALLAGHNVTDVGNYDDRAITRLLAEERRGRPDVLVLGSSRIQPLPAAPFPGQVFVNGGVSGGRLDDFIAVYSIYDTDARRPRRVVLHLDPFSVQFDPSGAPGGAFLETRAALLARLGSPTLLWRDRFAIRIAALKRISSPEYFRLSAFALLRHGPNGVRFFVTDRRQNNERTRTPDGTIVWSRVSQKESEQAVREYLSAMRTDDRYLNLDRGASERNLELLERFIRYLRSEGVDVGLVLAPYHPQVYAAFTRRPDHPLEHMEARYRAIARRTAVPITGGYDPALMGATESDFFDESHVRPAALERLVAGLRAR
jgi:hypothetical protein